MGKGITCKKPQFTLTRLCFPQAEICLASRFLSFLVICKVWQGYLQLLPQPQITHEQKPSQKPLLKSPPNDSTKFSLWKKKKQPSKSDFFPSFIVLNLQPSKPLHFSLLQALERAPASLRISFPFNSSPHSPCKLTILSFQLASPPRIHMDSWWAARNPK